ncbi:MAG: cytochrome c [Gemmatimonadaceae bacterium]|nr:cytochrome c [Gemmatimonadaceae bacterium]
MKTESTPIVEMATRVMRVAAIAMLPIAFGACTWFTDFKRQPAIEPWEPVSQNVSDTTTPPRGQPKYSVPMQGTSGTAYGISYSALPVTTDSFAAIPSPFAADARSLANGRLEYQINCAVCHGYAGDANGGLKRVNAGYAFAPSLLTDLAKTRTVGYIYGIIRNGRGVMPTYNRVEEADRWDVANYVKALQAGTADTTMAGMPGENGTTVPGPSQTAPTVPSRFAHPTVVPTRGSLNINSATFKGAEIKAPEGAASKEKPE